MYGFYYYYNKIKECIAEDLFMMYAYNISILFLLPGDLQPFPLPFCLINQPLRYFFDLYPSPNPMIIGLMIPEILRKIHFVIYY